jgi:hypothetical protein
MRQILPLPVKKMHTKTPSGSLFGRNDSKQEAVMADAAIHGHEHEDQRGFLPVGSCRQTTKTSGLLYLIVSALVGFVSVAFTVYMRMELMEPGVQYMCMEGARFTAAAVEDCTPNGHLWNVLITGHGILMMFFVVIPRCSAVLATISCRCKSARLTWRSHG